MARNLPNSRVNPEAVDADEAYLRAQARKEDMDRDLKVDQIMDQPGRGSRPSRRLKNRPRNY